MCICYFFFSKKSTSLFIGNDSKIQKQLNNDTILTSIFGWMGIVPLVFTICALIRKYKMWKFDLNTPTPFLIDFMKSNVLIIEANYTLSTLFQHNILLKTILFKKKWRSKGY
jgi:hypothetical protein